MEKTRRPGEDVFLENPKGKRRLRIMCYGKTTYKRRRNTDIDWHDLAKDLDR